MFEQVMETGFFLRDKQSQIPECVLVVRGSPMRLTGCVGETRDSDALFKLTYTLIQDLTNTLWKHFTYN